MYRERMGWDGQEGPRIFIPGTGRMSHGIPGHPTAKSDNLRYLSSCHNLEINHRR